MKSTKTDQQTSYKDLSKPNTKNSLRTHSQKARNSSSLSPNSNIPVKEALKFLNPIEEILPKGVAINLKKKKPTKIKGRIQAKPIQTLTEKPEKLENGLIFIAKNMKIVEDRSRLKEVSKRKEPVFITQIQTIFKYILGPGNNSELVKRVLGKRDHWEETSGANTLFNFIWKQDNKGYHYERIIPDNICRQCFNHFEFHREISTKSGLIENMAMYCEVKYREGDLL